MGTSQRHYTEEFRPEAVGLLASSGRPLSQIAQELGIASSRLRAWRNRDEGVRAGSPWRPNTQAAIPPAGADLAAENARLRRENERLHMEREVLKKRCAFSRKRRDEISSYRRSARYLQGSCHVRCAGRLSGGVLRLAQPPREPSEGGQPCLAGRDLSGPRGTSRAIRRAQDSRDLARRGAYGEPQSRTAHASSRHPGTNATTVSGAHHGQPSRLADRAEFARTDLRGDTA